MKTTQKFNKSQWTMMMGQDQSYNVNGNRLTTENIVLNISGSS